MKILNVFLLISFMLTIVVSSISAQDIYKVKTHEVVISGTSNIHDWTATVIDLNGSAQNKFRCYF